MATKQFSLSLTRVGSGDRDSACSYKSGGVQDSGSGFTGSGSIKDSGLPSTGIKANPGASVAGATDTPEFA